MKGLWSRKGAAGKTPAQAGAPDSRVNRRIVILLAVMTAITVLSVLYGYHAASSHEPGMQEIAVLSTNELTCGGDFTFYYYLGLAEDSTAAEKRAVRALYSQAAADAYQLFSAEVEFSDCRNLRYISAHRNEDVSIDSALYEALALMEDSGTRYHYLAPLYGTYISLFQCGSAYEAIQYDPFQNPDVRAFFEETITYTNDPSHIQLELLGNDTVRLHVSDAYLRFAEENGIEQFVDLFWMKNAFAADYIANVFMEQGYSRGILVSRDGFVRKFDNTQGAELDFVLSHREGLTVSTLKTLRFAQAVSIVYLHDYPLGEADQSRYYVCEDGSLRFPFVDTASGLCTSAVPELAASAQELSCAALALKLAPVYISEDLDRAALQRLEGEGITVYSYAS